MKTIAIITHWKDNDNYGAMLQTYALQHYLNENGYNAYVIKYYESVRKATKIDAILHYICNPMLFFRRKSIAKKIRKYNDWNKIRDFESFRMRNIKFSDKTYKSYEELKENPPVADIYITGSDQVWSGDLRNSQTRAYFLDFGNDLIYRMSYAASFGRSYFPCYDEALFVKLLKKFNKISIREQNGIEICKSLGLESSRCVDSTLLLDINDYMPLVNKRMHEGDYAFIYTVNISTPDEIYWPKLKKLLTRRGLKPIVTTGSGYTLAEEIFEGAEYDYASVEQWLSNVYYSNVVITASFHGIVFSLLFQKNFIYMPLKGTFSTGNNRVIDLLDSFGLKNRVAHNWSDVYRLFDEKIDYNTVDNTKFRGLRDFSKDFLDLIIVE